MAESSDDYSRSMGGQALAARLRRLSERFDRDGTRIYAVHDVNFEQRWYGVLRQLMTRGPMSVGEIAAALKISHASVSEARRSMEKAGIITAQADPDDGRKRTLHLTPDGESLCRQLGPLWAAFNKVAEELNAEAGDVVALLDRLDDALDRCSMYERIIGKLDDM